MKTKIYFSDKVSPLASLNRLLKTESFKDSEFFLLVDENTYANCMPHFISYVDILDNVRFFEVPVGEEAKSLEVASQLWSELLESGADRNSVIINLGGGAVCDLGGFVAAGFKRGIRYINVPTTLIGMVDAALGGKTAVNLESAKNQIGFFYPPTAVVVDPVFLDTLEDDECLSGCFEIVKTLLLSDAEMLKSLESILSPEMQLDIDCLRPYIRHCVDFKQAVTQADPYERSLRKILNLGHTLGHGIESYAIEQGSPIPHGYAVALGLAGELYLSVNKLGLDKQIYLNYCKMIGNFISFPKLKLKETEAIMKYIRQDKKNRDGLILCTLLKDVGVPMIDVVVDENEVRDALMKIVFGTNKR